MVTSDHSPCEWKDKETDSVFKAWGGISGGQFTLLSVVEIALKHHLPLTQVAAWTAAHLAKRFDLSPEKGEIRQGADADLAILDLHKPEKVTKAHLFQKNKFSLYVGHTFPASIAVTISRGNVVYSEGKVTQTARGQWVHPLARKALSAKN
jgi:allantoinase